MLGRFSQVAISPITLGTMISSVALVEMIATPAAAKTFFTTKQLLAEQFATAEKVSYIRVRLDPQRKLQVEKKLGYHLPRESYTFYVARKNNHPIGFALFDEDKGQHEMISLATFFDAKGTIARVEIVAYREPYGDKVREARFRRQFIGKDQSNQLAAEKDIDVISGATISSYSVARAVRRAAVLVEDAKFKATTIVQR